MGLNPILIPLFIMLFLSNFKLSTSQTVVGKVSCIDCTTYPSISGIKVSLKCDGGKRTTTATTDEFGRFKTKLPLDTTTKTPLNCLAMILGGPEQLYVPRNMLTSKIVETHGSNSYTLSSTLNFAVSCPSDLKVNAKCGGTNGFESSKTFDLPVPREWGLAPTSFYAPFFPIIGIP